MLNVRFIVKMLGVMFILETFFMLAATVVAFLYRGSDVYPLLISSGILFGTGFLFYSMGFKANEHSAGRREGMLIVTLTWILFSLFGMLPFYIGGYIDNVTDAFFETMSGFTTTGSTILTNIETLPKGILFWRSLTQWQGGIGMVVFTVALMPIFGGGASQMFDAETPGITHERFRPRITQVAKRLWGVYVFLTLFLVGLLWAGPMNLYDAVNHAFTAISTGGYSTKNASIAYWNSSYIEYVITIFMFIGATNMTLVYFCFNGNVKKLIKDEGMSTAVGDEGGFAPEFKSQEDALDHLVKAIQNAGFEPGKDFVIAIDAASSEWKSDKGIGFYHQPKSGKDFTSDELIEYWEQLIAKYPIYSIEDGLDEEDWEGWKKMTERIGHKVQLVGDDLFVTNTERLKKGIEMGVANSILIKLNQIGSVSETLETIKMAQKAGYTAIVSHRSGETEDVTIADLAVALNAGQIKTGAPSRSERVAKYNQLLRIEENLGDSASYLGKKAFNFER